MQVTAGEQAEVVILDHEGLRRLREYGRKLACPTSVQRRAGRVLAARSDDRRARAALECGPQRARTHAVLVELHRLERQTARPQQIEQRGIAGVLDGDAIAWAQMGVEHALDAVERAADDAERIARDTVRAKLLAARARSAPRAPRARRTGAREAAAGQRTLQVR